MRIFTLFLSLNILIQSLALSGECIVARTWTEADGREGKAYYCPPIGVGEPPDLVDLGFGGDFEFKDNDWDRQGKMSNSSFNSLGNNPYGQSIFKRSIQAIFSKPALKSPEQERKYQKTLNNAKGYDQGREVYKQSSSEFNRYAKEVKQYTEDTKAFIERSSQTRKNIDEIINSKGMDKSKKRALLGLYKIHLDDESYEGELQDEINTLRYKFWSVEKEYFNTEESFAFLDMSAASYRAGTELALNKDFNNARTMLGLSNTFLDISLGLTPFVGFLKDAYEAYSGKNLITGESLSTFDRTMSFVGFSLGVASGGTLNATMLKSMKSLFPFAKKAVQAGIGIVNSARKSQWGKVFESVKPADLIKNGEPSKLLNKMRKDKEIPKDWNISKTARKQKDGISFHKPGTNKADEVRIMSGKSTSPYPVSQKPYVRWKKDGKWLDRNGVPTVDPNKNHIPLDEFKFKSLE